MKNLNELEYVGGEVLANIWFDKRVVRIDPENGNVLGFIDFSTLDPKRPMRPGTDVLNGVAVDGGSIPAPMSHPGVRVLFPSGMVEVSDGKLSVGGNGGRLVGVDSNESSVYMPLDGVRLFITGKLWDKLFEVRLKASPRM